MPRRSWPIAVAFVAGGLVGFLATVTGFVIGWVQGVIR